MPRHSHHTSYTPSLKALPLMLTMCGLGLMACDHTPALPVQQAEAVEVQQTTATKSAPPKVAAAAPRVPTRHVTTTKEIGSSYRMLGREVLHVPQGLVEYHFAQSLGQQPVLRLLRGPEQTIDWRWRGKAYDGRGEAKLAALGDTLVLLQWHVHLDEPTSVSLFDLEKGTLSWTREIKSYEVLKGAPLERVSMSVRHTSHDVLVTIDGPHHGEVHRFDAISGDVVDVERVEAGPRSGAAGGRSVSIY